MLLLELPDDVLGRILHFCTAPVLARFRSLSSRAAEYVSTEMEHRYGCILSTLR